MTLDIAIVLIIIVIALYLFITEKLGVDTISIIIMIILMVTGVLTPLEGFAGFTNPATITVACMFVISAAIFKSGALNQVVNILNVVGAKSYTLTILMLMSISGILSAFMNDTAVVAILLPATLSMAKKTKISPSRLLIPLSFGALLGGICTLIGTSTNILVSGIAEKQGLEPIGMFEMTKAGLCFMAIGIIYMLLTCKWLLPDRSPASSISEEFEMNRYVTEIILLPEAKSVGKSIKESPLVKKIDIKIIGVTRQDKAMNIVPDFVLEAGDHLKVVCEIEKLYTLLDSEGMELKSKSNSNAEQILQDGIMLVEALITVDSSMADQTLKQYAFRSRFDGANVIAVRHRDQIVHDSLKQLSLKPGDVLLISCTKDQIQQLKQSDDLLVISEIDHRPFNLRNMLYIIGIVAGVVLSAAFHIAPIMLTATIGVVVLIALRFLKTSEAYEAIDWKIVFMLAGVLSLGTALEKTGAATLIASILINSLGTLGPNVLLSIIFGLTFLSTNVMSNNATAALLTPIAITSAMEMGVDSRPFIVAVAFAASLSFMTPMGYQTNTMIYSPGNYKFKDYIRVGTPLNILLWIMATILIPYFFPFK